MNCPNYRIAYMTYCNICECIKISYLFKTIGAIRIIKEFYVFSSTDSIDDILEETTIYFHDVYLYIDLLLVQF